MTDGEYRIEGARVVGGEYRVSLSIMTEYELTVVAGHHESDAVEIAEERAIFGDEKPADRFTPHADVEQLREIYEDDVEAGQLEYMDAPTAPSEDTYWDDSRHFELEREAE
ncbi:hypothetical protein Htur_5084 (plasmid) [Haloterrigena turkmenica DSM 5511]|uniref:Uncharacterized protein n=1 Tax=Haloterrigena turkmenica (strain ATCC 51198 / DSM 5511 / JCM 9101 / NCIMB 13204 / VKM B-1734 / 4k) TaxID=543526 RepID=D2S3M4_HALTV|nr:hypothetical protein [Haloterrigena turkmenica]ADB63971.1 hypothetical protein Htur_5084 [Haloterrigena turkmenica DSM 5511]